MMTTLDKGNDILKEILVVVISTSISVAIQVAAEKFFSEKQEEKNDNKEQPQEAVLSEDQLRQMIDESVKNHLDLRFSEYVKEQKKQQTRRPSGLKKKQH
jgi:long-subunit acyl-CoA synthetase (AMP-forming)